MALYKNKKNGVVTELFPVEQVVTHGYNDVMQQYWAECRTAKGTIILHMKLSDHTTYNRSGVVIQSRLSRALINVNGKRPTEVRMDDWEETVTPENMTNFEGALQALKSEKKVSRQGWRNQFLFLVPGSKFEVNRPPLLGIYAEGTTINYHPHIDVRTEQGLVVPWTATQEDLLASDWSVIK